MSICRDSNIQYSIFNIQSRSRCFRRLIALVCALVCVGSRLASLRLLVRGRIFIATFVFAWAFGAFTLVAVLRVAVGGALGALLGQTIAVVGSAAATAVVAPTLFRLCRRIDVSFARTEREREAIREGYLG